jgi:serine/threonine-protein kinase
MAHLKSALGDAVGGARDIREGLRAVPGSVDLAELRGRLLIEIGPLEQGIAQLVSVVALEPHLTTAKNDLLRARALTGDWAMFDALAERVAAKPETVESVMMVTRLSAWRRDTAMVARVRAAAAGANLTLPPELAVVLEALESGVASEATLTALETLERTGPGVRAVRRNSFFRQIAAEVLAYSGTRENAVAAIERSDELGLIDLVWLDRCPLIAPLAEVPAVRAVRERVARRGQQVRDVLEGRIP